MKANDVFLNDSFQNQLWLEIGKKICGIWHMFCKWAVSDFRDVRKTGAEW